jgi:hypothetical protein
MGVPRNPVPCKVCGDVAAPAKSRVCPACRLEPSRAYPRRQWTAEQEEAIRGAYLCAETRKQLSIELRKLSTSWNIAVVVIRGHANHRGLKLVGGRGNWTRAEDRYLEENAGVIRTAKLGRILGRTYFSVLMRMRRIGLERRVLEGYTAKDLADGFGVQAATVLKWEARKLLRRRDGRFTDAEVRRFVLQHLDLIPFKRVDEPWFKGVIDRSFGLRRGPARAEHGGGEELSA